MPNCEAPRTETIEATEHTETIEFLRDLSVFSVSPW